MTTDSRIRRILGAWRGVLICVVVGILSLVLLSEGGVWFDRLAGLPGADELLTTGLAARNSLWVEKGLRQGASPNARDSFGNSPLVYAAGDGDRQMVRRLIAAGAEVSPTSYEQMTPLASAAIEGHSDVVEMLLGAGAKVDQNVIFQRTALHLAAGASHEETVALLLDHGAAVDARDHLGRTPLLVAMYLDEEAALPCVRRLVEAGANVDAADADGATALMAAANDGHEELVAVLLRAGANAAVRDSRQQTASMLARGNGHAALAARLEPERRSEVSPPRAALERVHGVPPTD